MKTYEKTLLLAWCTVMLGFILLSFVPITYDAQLIFSVFLLLLLLGCYQCSNYLKGETSKDFIRLVIIFICVFLMFRYMRWRAVESLPMQFGVLSMICGLFLFLAELHGQITALIGFFINSQPYYRKSVPVPGNRSLLPHVDVYIPTYNEDAAIIRPTAIAATQMNYPAEKLHVYILDDGGTEQKLNDKNAEKAAAARERADELKAIADKFGAGYITRKKNERAKAGNINNALQYTQGKLLLILDCDHIPTVDFLEKTVGFFLADPKLFVVQTPHNFVTPEPLQRNLDIYHSCPAENELFYDVMQPGLDTWGTSFFCGSAAVLRREVLDKLGGIAGQTITEDAETTMDALAMGYTSAYFNHPMVSGLQPETYSGFILQRVRWSQGMLQIFILKNPWQQKGLKLLQRLLYTNFAFYWGFASAKMVMLLAPPVFLIFSINLCDATAGDLINYAGPYLISSLVSTQYFYGRVRWPFMSQLYETIQSAYIASGLMEVAKNSRSPSFKVTPKGEVLNNDFISSLIYPFYFFLLFNFTGIVLGIHRYLTEPREQTVVAFVLFWAVLDVALLLAALGVMLEKKQLRLEPRVPHDEKILIRHADGLVFHGKSRNVSFSGIDLMIDHPGVSKNSFILQDKMEITFLGENISLTGKLVSYRRIDRGKAALGFVYDLQSVADERKAIRIAFGSSDRLLRNNQQRHQGKSIMQGLIYILKIGFSHGFDHIIFLMKKTVARMGS